MLAAQRHIDSRRVLAARLDQARAQTDKLFELVRPDSLYDRPIPERHRIVFYIGHLEAFDWNLLQPDKPFDPNLDRLFAFGIDPVDGGLPVRSAFGLARARPGPPLCGGRAAGARPCAGT